MADWSDLIGLSLEAAQKRAEKYGHTVVVVRYNDRPATTTRDYIETRIRIAVQREEQAAVDAPWIVSEIRGKG